MSDIQNKITKKLVEAAGNANLLAVSKDAESWNQHSKSFMQSGNVPSIKHEEWKYSNIERVLSQFEFVTGNFQSMPVVETNASENCVYLKNGFVEKVMLTTEISQQITVLPLEKAIISHAELVNAYYGKHAEKSKDFFTHLNNASIASGLFVHIPKQTNLSTPIFIIQDCLEPQERMVQSHHLFIVEEGANASFIQKQICSGKGAKSFFNVMTEVFVGENATFSFDRLQNDCSETHQVTNFFASLQKNALLDVVNVLVGSAFTRNNYTVNLDGEFANAKLAGLFIGNEQQHADSWVMINHNQPNCESDQVFKSIVDDSATSVFAGKIYVDQIAQKTNAYQSNKNIVLTDDANAYSKPQLEIYADDVKCSHGSTTGHIDDDALFYLRARGITEASARKLLLFSFAENVVERIHDEEFHTEIQGIIYQKFGN